MDWKSFQAKVARDHVHVFVSYRPTQKVSQIMQWLKGIISRVLLQEFSPAAEAILGEAFLGAGLLGSE